MKTPELDSGYWDQVIDEQTRSAALRSWRDFMCKVYRDLLDSWIPEAKHGLGLKTDLFEEALTPHSLIPHMGSRVVGIDRSIRVVKSAKRMVANCGAGLLVVCDVRQLPIRSAAVQYILSGSSLDHFTNSQDISKSFAELNRILISGGIAVITLDNPHNPVVWVRNRLPLGLLKRLKLVPYYMGFTLTRGEARKQLREAGFEVLEIRAIVHAPRIFAIHLFELLERLHWTALEAAVSRAVVAFERLAGWPTRFHTGYYVAYRVRKRA